MNSLDNH